MLNIINKRKSIRGYNDHQFSQIEIDRIQNIIQQKITGPYGNRFDFKIILKGLQEYQGKIGTYGMITGNFGCIYAWVEDKEESNIDYGYCLEKIVLELTKIGIGTCWLGGTFNKKDLFLAANISSNAESGIPAIVTFGYPSQIMKVRHRIISYKPKNKKRKQFNELFMQRDGSPIERNSQIIKSLEAVQIAPSAVNFQPWRIVIEDKIVHFYNTDSKHRSIHSIDMGIAMNHLDISRKEVGLNGYWENFNMEPYNNWRYVMSFHITG